MAASATRVPITIAAIAPPDSPFRESDAVSLALPPVTIIGVDVTVWVTTVPDIVVTRTDVTVECVLELDVVEGGDDEDELELRGGVDTGVCRRGGQQSVLISIALTVRKFQWAVRCSE